MKLLLPISLCLFYLASCREVSSVRIEKKFVVDSAWHIKNENGIPPDIEGKNKALVNGHIITTQSLYKVGDSVTLYYYKHK